MSEPDKPLSLTEQEINAIKAIALSDDGALLHRYLRRVLETVIDMQSDGALREQNGRRSLARDLMRHMAEGLNDRRDASNDPILSRPSGGIAVARPRGAGRRVNADTPTGYTARDE